MTKILGRARLDRKFRKMPKLYRREIRTEMERAANEMVALMKRLVHNVEGDLEASIGWTWGTVLRDGRVTVISLFAIDESMTITIYAGNKDAFHARWEEFGTQYREGHPFFFVAHRALKKRTKARFRRASTKAARAVVKA
ncbi:MAG: HK97 gp10 family phage protein [Alphaproteobacteria bacterium]|nr:HK97 gp10 family phage protein [Alphaproteobacteria bacterium]